MSGRGVEWAQTPFSQGLASGTRMWCSAPVEWGGLGMWSAAQAGFRGCAGWVWLRGKGLAAGGSRDRVVESEGGGWVWFCWPSGSLWVGGASSEETCQKAQPLVEENRL